MRPHEINCISLSNIFGAKEFHNLVKRRVEIENLIHIFAIEGVINSEILKSFTKFLFQNQTGSFKK